jgi:NAD(P) transhydrogenase subunit alpha
MKIAVPKEVDPKETRVALIPTDAAKLVKAGATVTVEAGVGASIRVADSEYEAAGAAIADDRRQLVSESDLVLRVSKPPTEEIEWLAAGALHVSYLDPFNNGELVDTIAARDVSLISMEMVPRITRAQKMDALSSQASLAGYAAVIVAAERLDKAFPMMMTPAGTISPSRVFVMGAGVAGLQAIATAKRLGARVEAIDIRPDAEEQVASLGAKFVKIDIGETGETAGGYAKELTPEQQELQRQGMVKVCANSDVIITTAQLFGRPAPRMVTGEMVAAMRPGSIIVDMAVASGGNVEGSVPDEEVEVNGVRIIGMTNLPGAVAVHASQMYSSNMVNLIMDGWDEEAKAYKLDREDDIVKGCLLTHGGEVVNEMLLKIRADQKRKETA